MTLKRLGVFGGAFDPPHLAHRALAEAALRQLELDQLRILPTGQAWHKTRPLNPAHHRLAMARLAFGDLPKVVIDERELVRAGPTFTVDTLLELQKEHPQAEFFLCMGLDQAQALTTWHHWEQVLSLATICVADRDLESGETNHFDPPVHLKHRFISLVMPRLAISATDIRARCAKGKKIDAVVNPAVAGYIDDHQLYLIHNS